MAKKTNKTDHVLNLLSTGAKKGGSGKEGRDAPPVQLKRPDSGEMDAPVQEDRHPDVEPRVTPVEPEPDLPDLPDVPEVSVVHADGGESPVADAVKASLEAELEEYLKDETDAESQAGRQQEEAGLPDLTEPEAAAIESEVDLPDLTDKVSQEPSFDVPDVQNVVVQSSDSELPDIQEEIPERTSGEQPEAQFPDKETLLEDIPEETREKEDVQPEPQEAPDAEQSEKAPEVEPPESEETVQPEPDSHPTAETVDLPVSEESPADGEEEEPDYAVVNVMEHLVRNQAIGYIRQFGHCDCARCIEDTVALALTHLPAKYVVVNKNAVSPLLNFYEKKFAGQLIVEITKASMVVNETPHHNR